LLLRVIGRQDLYTPRGQAGGDRAQHGRQPVAPQRGMQNGSNCGRKAQILRPASASEAKCSLKRLRAFRKPMGITGAMAAPTQRW